jgi:hypothetical protein
MDLFEQLLRLDAWLFDALGRLLRALGITF